MLIEHKITTMEYLVEFPLSNNHRTASAFCCNICSSLTTSEHETLQFPTISGSVDAEIARQEEMVQR